MRSKVLERRHDRRYDIQLPIHFRTSQYGEISRWAAGTTCNLSRGGIGLRCRRPLVVGSHIEMIVPWPARHDDVHPIELHANGIVVRATPTRAAVRITWCRFNVIRAGEALGATA